MSVKLKRIAASLLLPLAHTLQPLSIAELKKISLEAMHTACVKKGLDDAAHIRISCNAAWRAEWLAYHSALLVLIASASSLWAQVLATRRAIIQCSQASISAIPYLFCDFADEDKQTLADHFHSGKEAAVVIRTEEKQFCFAEASCSCLIAIARRLGDSEDGWHGAYSGRTTTSYRLFTAQRLAAVERTICSLSN